MSEEMSVETKLIARYQQCVYRIWDLFPNDPLPDGDPAHFLCERLESILDRGLLVPKNDADGDKFSANFLEAFASESPETQWKLIEQRRKLDRSRQQFDRAHEDQEKRLQERWLMVPVWRRAIILAAEWVQLKFTPKYF